MNINKRKSPYIRDVYLTYLIEGARHTKTDEYPIVEEWMVANEPPNEIIQWDRRYDVKTPSKTAISFYCCDPGFQPILANPKVYIDKMKKYQCVIGMDASPFDNMPIVVQKSQIFLNIAITYYFGKNDIKIIPNIRLGDDRTLSSLEAYPKHTLIALGTNGFVKNKTNRKIFASQVKQLVDYLEPSGICVYGPTPDDMFSYVKTKGIVIYQYDSFTMKENKNNQKRNLSEVAQDER